MRRLLLRIGFSFGALIVLGALAEFGLWASGRIEDPTEFRFRRTTRAVQQDDAGRYALHATRFYTTAAGYRHGDHHLGRYATGDWPFRGPVPGPRPDGLLRVAVLGDSCVYGAGVDVADSLPHRIARALRARGFGPESVEVLNFGVPGYSTVQIRLMLDEVLAEHAPDAVVLYPAAWNDQAPALRAPDAELLAAARDPSWLDRLEDRSRLVAAARHLLTRVPHDEIVAGWRAGDPPLGWRATPDEVVTNVRAMVEACAAVGVPVVVMTAAHPAATRAKHPRTAADASAIADAVDAIDGQAILESAGGDAARFFVDHVHPSPHATRLLAEPVADRLAAALAAPEAPPPLDVVAVTPAQTSTFGDAEVAVLLDGWSSADPLPTVVVGGAPLLAPRADGPHRVLGTLAVNGPGRHDVVVTSARARGVARGGLQLVEPSVAYEPGAAAPVVLRSRPGDVGRVRVATSLRSAPSWSNRGALWLDEATRKGLPGPLVCGEDGVARTELPPDIAAGTDTLHLQALVAPAGEPGFPGPAARWTPVTTVTLD